MEFEGGLYWDDKLGPYIPADMLRNRLTTGARLIRAGKKIECGCRSPNSCRSGNRPLRRRGWELAFVGSPERPDPRAYMRLAELIEAQIVGGTVPAGTPLASIGELRLKHGHSRQTVGKAMRVLEGRNRVYRMPGLGYFVGSPPPS